MNFSAKLALVTLSIVPIFAHAEFTLDETVAPPPPTNQPKVEASATAASEAVQTATLAAIAEATKAPTPIASEKPIVVTPPVVESWVVSPNDVTLRRVLAKWSAKAGWQLTWEAGVDIPLTVSATFDGSFKDAIKSLFSSLSASDVNLSAMLYKGNRVLRVTEAGHRAQ